MKKLHLILDLEADGGIFSNKHRSYNCIDESIEFFSKFCQENDLKINAFVEGQLLEEREDIIDNLKGCNISYNGHSFNHQAVYGTTQHRIENISKGLEAFQRFFGKIPMIYRAPNGIVNSKELDFLYQNKIKADSSIYPTWFPGRFNYRKCISKPHRHKNGILILPATTITRLRIPFALSYMQLLGKRNSQLLFNNLPDDLTFCFHFHDFCPGLLLSKIGVTSLAYWGYLKNSSTDGKKLLSNMIQLLLQMGYQTDFMSNKIDKYHEMEPCN